MDIHELRKMTLPKLRDLAKQVTDLQGVIGMKKEELIRAVAKAQGITYEAPTKDITTMSSLKKQIRELKKQRDEILASNGDRARLRRIREQIKRLKRSTRKLAEEARRKAPTRPAPETTQAAQAG